MHVPSARDPALVARDEGRPLLSHVQPEPPPPAPGPQRRMRGREEEADEGGGRGKGEGGGRGPAGVGGTGGAGGGGSGEALPAEPQKEPFLLPNKTALSELKKIKNDFYESEQLF